MINTVPFASWRIRGRIATKFKLKGGLVGLDHLSTPLSCSMTSPMVGTVSILSASEGSLVRSINNKNDEKELTCGTPKWAFQGQHSTTPRSESCCPWSYRWAVWAGTSCTGSTWVFRRRTQREAHYGSIVGFIFKKWKNKENLDVRMHV